MVIILVYYCLLFNMAKGSSDQLLPVHKEEYLQSGYFTYARKAISLSVVHEGIEFLGMSRALAW